tara:strand:- start:2447 stop:3604 length:1158 start_codon:yes stop_codon:yes gene_type:complete
LKDLLNGIKSITKLIKFSRIKARNIMKNKIWINNEIDFFALLHLIKNKFFLILSFGITFLILFFFIENFTKITNKYIASVEIRPLQESQTNFLTNLVKASRQFKIIGDINSIQFTYENPIIEYSNKKMYHDFFLQLNSAKLKIDILKELEFFSNLNLPTEDYEDLLRNFIKNYKFVIRGDPNSMSVIYVELTYSDKEKLKKFINKFISKAASNVLISLRKNIEDNINYIEILNEMEKKEIRNLLENYKTVTLSKDQLLKLEGLSISDTLQILRKSEILFPSNKDDPSYNMHVKNFFTLEAIKDKFIAANNSIILDKVKKAYNLSGIKNLNHPIVNFSQEDIIVIEDKKYWINLPLIGFIFGIFLGIVVVIIRKSYEEYKINLNNQ